MSNSLVVIRSNRAVTTLTPNLTEAQRWDLTPQARKVFDHMRRAGSISARDAMADHQMTSATLARRVCDLEEAGVVIVRESKEHPIVGTRYTRYSVGGNRHRAA